MFNVVLFLLISNSEALQSPELNFFPFWKNKKTTSLSSHGHFDCYMYIAELSNNSNEKHVFVTTISYTGLQLSEDVYTVAAR